MCKSTAPALTEKYVSSPYIYFTDVTEGTAQINNFLTKKKQRYSIEYIKILDYCKRPAMLGELIDVFFADAVRGAIAQRLLIREDALWHPNVFQSAEIEITTHCNYRCQYCPVHEAPKTPKIMSVTDFFHIIQKIKESSSIRFISFSAYNEPLIDPFIFDRLKIVADNKLRLILHTNGSGLTPKKADYLYELGNVEEIHINFPCYDRKKYAQYTGRDTFDLVRRNIDYAIDLGLNLNFSVQKAGVDYKEDLRHVNEVYSRRIGKRIVVWNTVDRAGSLQNEYRQGIHVPGMLAGCKNILDWLSIDVDGNCYICCNDFYTKYTYGNILTRDINGIVGGLQYEKLLRQIFGDIAADEGFICRKCFEMKLMSVYKRMDMQARKKLN